MARGSGARMGVLVGYYGGQGFWKIFGRHWGGCDFIANYSNFLHWMFRRSRKHAPFRSAMDARERAIFDLLPPVMTAWRGCYRGINENGFSWSLSRDIAAGFPYLRRYSIEGEQAILLEGQVEKRRIFFLTNASLEREIVVLPEDVTVVNTYDLRAGAIDSIPVHGGSPALTVDSLADISLSSDGDELKVAKIFEEMDEERRARRRSLFKLPPASQAALNAKA